MNHIVSGITGSCRNESSILTTKNCAENHQKSWI